MTATLSAPATPIPDSALRLRSDVAVRVDGTEVRLVHRIGAFLLRGVDPTVAVALQDLTRPNARIDAYPPTVADRLTSLARRMPALFVRGVRAPGGDTVLATVERTRRDADYAPADVTPDVLVRLSRFALLRTLGDELVLESPLAGHRFTPRTPETVALVASLGSPRTAADLASDMDVAAVLHLLGHLVGAGFAELAGPGGLPSDTEPTLRQWDFHDLLTHSRARSGRFDQPFGGIFPYVGEIEPQPAVKPVPDGPTLDLPRPELRDVLTHDPALTTVLEGRTSVRRYAEQPMTVEQLGEFLYRTARVRAVYGPSEGAPYEASTRPYPCGGAAYELELYLTVQRCTGVEPGVYYYDPMGHRLVLVNRARNDRDAMLHTASVATGLQADPDVLVTMTSRFQRLAWKYRAIAYSVSLKHAGVLYQTMYLVATAMGLAPCGLGSGDADLATRVLGLDYLHESSVGDFILGSRPAAASSAVSLPPAWRPVNDPQWGVAAQATLRREWSR